MRKGSLVPYFLYAFFLYAFFPVENVRKWRDLLAYIAWMFSPPDQISGSFGSTESSSQAAGVERRR
jgi:hypothetical protein